MKNIDVHRQAPIDFPRTVRPDRCRVLADFHAGKVVPVWAAPVFRQDSAAGSLRLHIGMDETVEKLKNGVVATARAWFVPFTASDRFDGIEDFDRAYKGVPDGSGEIKPLMPQMVFNSAHEFWSTMGVHFAEGASVNGFYVEAYNLLINAQRQRRSKKLAETPRNWNDASLATCLWASSSLDHVVPDFDDAMLDAEVPLTVVAGDLPVRGIGIRQSGAAVQADTALMKQATGVNSSFPFGVHTNRDALADQVVIQSTASGLPLVFAEMQENGITVNLANIDMAKKTQAFAKMRAALDVEDDHLLDLLMQGVAIPDQFHKEPMVIARKQSLLGYHQQFATDQVGLGTSRTTGHTVIDLPIRLPQTNVGGVIIVTVEVVPQMIYERRADPFLTMMGGDDFPNAMRDFLDPQKVEVVKAGDVDVSHTTPDAVFGYAPLNHKHHRDLPRLGGRYYRKSPSEPWNEARNEIWTPDVLDPQFNEDFVLAENLTHDVFDIDIVGAFKPFHLQATGGVRFVGLTQSGKGLQEATEDYDQILAQVDHQRLNAEEE